MFFKCKSKCPECNQVCVMDRGHEKGEDGTLHWCNNRHYW